MAWVPPFRFLIGSNGGAMRGAIAPSSNEVFWVYAQRRHYQVLFLCRSGWAEGWHRFKPTCEPASARNYDEMGLQICHPWDDTLAIGVKRDRKLGHRICQCN